MLVKYVSITPCSSGFGEYTTVYDSEIGDDADLLNGCPGEVYELGSEDLPDWVIDIRGSIHNEPQQVFVERGTNGETVTYFGFEGVGAE